MTTSYILSPQPLWNFNDFFAVPLSGGYMKTLLQSNPTQNKAVYSDPAGMFPWPDPIPFGANGMQGPFYFANDVPYRLEIYDSLGILQKVIDPYTPPSAGGGNVTTYSVFRNLLTNTQFLYPIQTQAPSIGAIIVAPGNNELLYSVNNGVVYYGNIFFQKSNLAATDQVSVVPFSLGTTSPPEGNPENYVSYVCTVAGSGETFKDFVYPIKGLRCLENQTISCSFSAISSSASTIGVFLLQNFGSEGAPSNPVYTSVLSSQLLTTSWAKYFASIVVPSAGGKTIGLCGDDYTALVIRMPLNQTSNVGHVNAQVCIGSVNFPYDYQTPDQVLSIISKPKTGQIKQCFSAYQEPGWVPLNNGSIGSASSGATLRANIDTFNLFAFLWLNVSNTYMPVSGGRGGNPNADFAANKTLTFTAEGRSLLCYGSNGINNYPMGFVGGSDTQVLLPTQLAAHDHDYISPVLADSPIGPIAATEGAGFILEEVTLATTVSGASDPFSVVSAVMASNFYIKL